MKTYNDFLNLIRSSTGQIVTIIKDFERINNIIINSFKISLSGEYVIKECEYSVDDILYQIKHIKCKTILFVSSYDTKIDRAIYNTNNYLIIIFLKRVFSTFNQTMLTNDNTCLYVSSVILLLKNRTVKIMKNRYGSVDDTMDMTIFTRKEKLLNLDKISKN